MFFSHLFRSLRLTVPKIAIMAIYYGLRDWGDYDNRDVDRKDTIDGTDVLTVVAIARFEGDHVSW